MTTLRDFLIWYNNRDVVPFLEAIDTQFAFYQQQHIDMFKDGISIPGLTLLYPFNDLPPNTYFTVFNRTNSDLHVLVSLRVTCLQWFNAELRKAQSLTAVLVGELCKAAYDLLEAAAPLT